MGTGIIRGHTVEEKFASANKALMQLERRIRARSIVAPLTPVVMMGYCDEDRDGLITRGICPISGFITKVSLHIERFENPEFLRRNVLEFTIESAQNDGTIVSRRFQSKRSSFGEFCNFKVATDSRISIFINAKVFGIWYGFIMEPEVPLRKKIDVDDISTDIEQLSTFERSLIEVE